MCRNIKPLFTYDPSVNNDEVRSAARRSVRTIRGFNKQSKANQAAFRAAIEAVAITSSTLLRLLETNASPRDREFEIVRTRAWNVPRFPVTRHEK